MWPWLCQVQVAPYSYDWIDNLGRRSPRELLGRPDPQPGEPFSRVGGRFPVGRVLAVEHGQHLTATIMGALMSYLLVPDAAGTRLLLKIVIRRRQLVDRGAGDRGLADGAAPVVELQGARGGPRLAPQATQNSLPSGSAITT